MPVKRTAEAIWIESKGYWQVKVQRNGIRKAFTSSLKGRKGKHAAEAKADEWLANGTEDMRIEAACKLFLDDQQRRTGTSNYKKHEWAIRLYVLPPLGSRKLSGITPVQWRDCLTYAAKCGLSRRSCENVRSTIRALISFARASRWTVNQPEKNDLIIPRTAPPPKKKRVLSSEAIRILFSDPCIVHHNKRVIAHYAYAWQFLVVTGMRRGEMCGLTNDDIENGVLSTRRSVNEYCEETTGKNDNACRSIELTQTARSVLESQRAYLKSQGISSAWLFPDKYGERVNPKCVYGQWRSWSKQHNISLSLHEMRHTFVSLNKADLPLALMKSAVGHSPDMDTYGVYGHEVEGDLHRTAIIVDEVFQKIFNAPDSNRHAP